jgi:rubrerythrin
LIQLSRFYYALDKISFDAMAKRSKVVHARFHGFLENANLSPPQRHSGRGLVPHYIVDQHWIEQTKNQDLPLNMSPEPESWKTLQIDDDEIDIRDLRAMREWENERQDGHLDIL